MSRRTESFEPDPVIEAYKRDVDRTLIRENLRLTVEQRFDALVRLQQFAEEFLLAGAGVEFIIVGGAAATAHGSARLTLDLDIVYRRTPANISRLVRSLAPH